MSATDDRPFADVQDRMAAWLAANPHARPEDDPYMARAINEMATALWTFYRRMGLPTLSQEGFEPRLWQALENLYFAGYENRARLGEDYTDFAERFVGELRALCTPAQRDTLNTVFDGLIVSLRQRGVLSDEDC
ncbi:MAG: hypothetical protein M3Q65_21735 [Chloroflexota bacterium]|nr:hypothetical protein [Chloroflexota bacterium]